MDRIIKITLSIFIIVLVTFVALVSYNGYVENAYRTSLTSTYSYSCTITTDSPLTNVTLFLPVPADRTGNSPVIAQLSAHEVSGVPGTWKTELYETGKSTMVKITTPSIIPPEGTSAKNPFTVTIYTNVSSGDLIDTRDPVENSPMFRPVQDVKSTACMNDQTSVSGGQCSSYLTSLYANYQAGPNAEVSVRSSLTGTNEWNVFEPKENEYRTDIYLLMFGEQKGWTTVRGYVESGIGAYDAPSLHA
jgi:hypothetical protein